MSTLGCLVVARVCWGEICRRVGVFKRSLTVPVSVPYTKSRIAYFVYFLDRIHFMSYDVIYDPTDMAFAFCELNEVSPCLSVSHHAWDMKVRILLGTYALYHACKPPMQCQR